MSDSPFDIKHRYGTCYATWYARRKARELAGKYGFADDEDEDLTQTVFEKSTINVFAVEFL